MVDLRESRLVFCIWKDHVSLDEWHSPKDSTQDILLCNTVGYLVHETEETIEIASTVEESTCCCSMLILKCCIVDMKDVAIVQNDISDTLSEEIVNL